MRKAPPVLDDGPFRNRYLQTRNPGGSESVTVWPPSRKRKENVGPTEVHAATIKTIAGQKTQQQVNAVASSSKVKLPASTALRPDDPFLIGTAPQKAKQLPAPMPKSAMLSKPQPSTSAVGSGNRTEQPPTKRQKFVHPAVKRQEPVNLASIPTSSPVAFIQNNAPPNEERPATRHIDLRESLRKRRLHSGRRSSLRSSRGSTASIPNSISTHANRRDSAASSASHHRRQHTSNAEDVELMSLFERDLAELGEQYGFALGVVKKTYLQFGTLEKTVVVLRALNAIMKGAQDKLWEEMERFENNGDNDADEGDMIPEGVIPKHVSSGGKGKEKEIGEGQHHGTPSNKRHWQSLNYKPLTIELEDQSEYSPPSRTRAGRYAKLQKEGREEEALIAASGGRIALHLRNEGRQVSGGREAQGRATTIKRGMEPSSPL
jgi:hypothetical protein